MKLGEVEARKQKTKAQSQKAVEDKTGTGTADGASPRFEDRGDKTAIELFLSGIRALALQSSIIDVLRTASR